MTRSVSLKLFLLPLCALGACRAAAAAELTCMKYVPAVDKNIPVPCDEFKRSAPPAPAPPTPPSTASPAAAPATKTFDDPLASLKKKLATMTTALTEAKADTAFRETFCTLNATAQVLHQQTDQSEIKRLQNEHIALEAKVGERGKWVYTALQEKLMEGVLGTPVDDAVPSTKLRQTPEGQAFLQARDGLHMSCNCMYEASPPNRLVCCDSCDQDTLKAKAAASR